VARPLQLRFRAVAEDEPGARWQALFARAWPDYRRWFLEEGDARRPGYLTCEQALRHYMPELAPTWSRLVGLAGGGDHEARMLSLFCPTPYLVACSQALWTRGDPVLIRNYDYHPDYCEGVLLRSCWRGTAVIASSDCLWGALDGMNADGLAVSLGFGGRRVVGEGFGIPLILRYLLETCRTVDEAAAVLHRVPPHMAYTVGLLDAAGAHATVYVGPDRESEVHHTPIATNHQGRVEWPEYAALTRSVERLAALEAALRRPDVTPERLLRQFLRPPIVGDQWERAFGTLYTAAYYPADGRVELHWPHVAMTQSFDRFAESETVVRYPVRRTS